MKTTEELKQLFESDLKPALTAIEGQRKNILAVFIVCIIGVLGSFAAAFFLAEYAIVFYLAIFSIIGFGYYWFSSMPKLKKEYRAIYKQDVVRAIVSMINPDWIYDPVGRISSNDYRKSQLFITPLDKYEGDDLVKGNIEKTDFEFSELHTRYKTYSTDNDGNKEEKWHTVFKGLFAHADFNKEINGRTFVLPERALKDFNKHGMKGDFGKTKIVKLENPEFEKIFKVFSTDQIESRYILTPSMMEAMVEIYKKYDKKVYFSFIGSRVYIAMNFSKDLFEPRILKSGVRFDDMLQMNDNFRLIQVIIREMNLNTRIWTKD